MTAMSWTAYIGAAALLLLAGISKLAGMVGVYEAVGIGQWLRYAAGSIEVMTAVSLLLPLPTSLGGIGLALTVAEAGCTHLALIAASAP